MAHSAHTTPLSRRSLVRGAAAISATVGISTVSAVLAASALPGVALAAHGAGHPDDELFKTVEDVLALSAKLADAHSRSMAAHDLAETLTPPWPEVARVRDADQSLYGLPKATDPRHPRYYTTFNLWDLTRFSPSQPYKVPLHQFVRQRPDFGADPFIIVKSGETDATLHKSWPEAQARVDEIIAALNAWKDQRDRALEVAGYGVIEEEIEAIDSQRDALFLKVMDTPATTLDGMRAKAHAVKCIYGEDDLDLGETTDMQLAASICNDLLRLKGAMTA